MTNSSGPDEFGETIALPAARPPPPPPIVGPIGGPSMLWLLLVGAGYGLLMRIVFGMAPFKTGANATGPMLISFLFLVPLALGALAIYRLPPARRTLANAILLPWLPTLLFIAGCAALLIEGSICIVMSLPIFMIMASIGGIGAWLVLKHAKPSPSTASAFLLLPLVTGYFERDIPLPNVVDRSESSIHIAAPPQTIWRLINDAEGIAPAEMADGLAYKIGVPYPIEAITVATPQGRVRKLRWDKGVHFEEPILDWDENRYIRWSYSFAADSIPAGALDEHVEIGGRYFDLVDTSYRLTPEGEGTRLAIVVNYRVSTGFNWYARTLGRWLVDDSADTILAFYKRRSERG